MLRFTKKSHDVLAGVGLAALGLFAAAEAYTYGLMRFGSIASGLFPFVVGLLLAAIGLAIAAGAILSVSAEKPAAFAGGRAVLLLPASVLLFAVLVDRAGLAPATFAATFTSALSVERSTLLGSLLVAACVTLCCVLIFRFGLGIQVSVFKW